MSRCSPTESSLATPPALNAHRQRCFLYEGNRYSGDTSIKVDGFKARACTIQPDPDLCRSSKGRPQTFAAIASQRAPQPESAHENPHLVRFFAGTCILDPSVCLRRRFVQAS